MKCIQLCLILTVAVSRGWSQLVVNVKNRGGDVEREVIEANTTADTIRLEYLSKDGTFVTQFIDFKSVCSTVRSIIKNFRFCIS